MYRNLRILFNQTEKQYQLAEVEYSIYGEIVDLTTLTSLGFTLAEVKEELEGLLLDIENWVEEEIQMEEEFHVVLN